MGKMVRKRFLENNRVEGYEMGTQDACGSKMASQNGEESEKSTMVAFGLEKGSFQ